MSAKKALKNALKTVFFRALVCNVELYKRLLKAFLSFFKCVFPNKNSVATLFCQFVSLLKSDLTPSVIPPSWKDGCPLSLFSERPELWRFPLIPGWTLWSQHFDSPHSWEAFSKMESVCEVGRLNIRSWQLSYARRQMNQEAINVK